MKQMIKYELSGREFKAENGSQYYLKPTGMVATKDITKATIIRSKAELKEALDSIKKCIKNDKTFNVSNLQIIDLENL